MPTKKADLVSFCCDNCGQAGGGSRVVNYADNMLRVMLPKNWKARSDLMPGSYRIISFFCPICANKQLDASENALS